MVGLAISMGASDVLNLWHAKAARAAEGPLAVEPLYTGDLDVITPGELDSREDMPTQGEVEPLGASFSLSTNPVDDSSSVAFQEPQVQGEQGSSESWEEVSTSAAALLIEPEAPVVKPEISGIELGATPVVQPPVQPPEAFAVVQEINTSATEAQASQTEADGVVLSGAMSREGATPSEPEVVIPDLHFYPAEHLSHVVAPGETLWDIAYYYGIDVSTLRSINRLAANQTLEIGQSLWIPESNQEALNSSHFSDIPLIPEQVEVGADTQILVPQTLASIDLDKRVDGKPISSPDKSQEQVDTQVQVKGKDTLTREPSLALEPEASIHALVVDSGERVPNASLATSSPESTAPVIAVAPSSIELSDLLPYRVQPGDTIDTIAQAHAVSRAELIAVNSLQNPNVLQVDQLIGIPKAQELPLLTPPLRAEISAPEAVTITSIPEIEVVAPSASVASPRVELAGVPELTWQVNPSALDAPTPDASALDAPAAIATVPETNGLLSISPERLLPAQSFNPGPLDYQIREGDTLVGIARQHKVSLQELIEVNRITDPNIIFANQSLTIPGSDSIPATPSYQESVVVAHGTSDLPEIPLFAPVLNPDMGTTQESSSLDGNLDTVNAPLVSVSQSQEEIMDAAVSQGSELLAVAEVTQSTTLESPLTEVLATQTQPDSNPYLQDLMVEIRQLQHQYREENNPTAQTDIESAVPIVALPDSRDADIARETIPETIIPEVTVPETLGMVETQPASVLAESELLVSEPLVSVTSRTERINPEFDPLTRTDELAETIETTQVPIAPEFEAIPVSPAISPNLPEQEQVVAVAPIGSQNYEPLVQSLLGQTVSPDLPPLSADPYLPEEVSQGYTWPAQGVLTSGFGWRWGRMHKGIDIAGPVGTPIVAASSGRVIYSGWNSGGYGNLVEIEHSDGSITLYAHNSRLLVTVGQWVQKGQQIAEMGSTGYSTGPHLHFEIHPSGQGAVNPMAYLPR
jgi:murein DD-endopeptidase MepM/ murein hydrolase activator NlpD